METLKREVNFTENIIKRVTFLILVLLLNKNCFGSITWLDQSNFNATDVTTVVQNALDSSVDTICFKNVGNPWIVKPLFLKRDNLTIIMEFGVVLKAKSGAFTGSNDILLKVSYPGLTKSILNTKIVGYGAAMEMIKSEYTTGEWRHCLSFQFVDGVQIYGLTIKGSGGDGIYIGSSSGGAPSKNIYIKDCISDNHRRQGISVISSENLTIEDCVFKNTSGTSPMAGIDFEPNKNTEALKNILLKNCRFTGNSYGILFALGNMDGTSAPLSVKIENCYMSNSKWGIAISKGQGYKGFIQVNKCLIENMILTGFSLYSEAYAGIDVPVGSNPNKVFIKFTECVWRNVHNKNQSPFLISPWGADSTKAYGGAEFKDCVLEDTQSLPFLTATDGNNTGGLAQIKGNINVINPLGATMNTGSKPNDVTLSVSQIKNPVSVTASIIASDPNAYESNLDPGTFTVSRNTTHPAIVSAIDYDLTGTAGFDLDYSVMNGFVIISPNTSSATATLVPLKDPFTEPTETVIATIVTDQRPAGIAASYTVGSPSNATVYIDPVVSGIAFGNSYKTDYIIYPNPFHTNFTLQISSETIIKDATMKIYDVFGKEVRTLSVNDHKTIIHRDELKDGIYFYQLINNNESAVKGKLIIQ